MKLSVFTTFKDPIKRGDNVEEAMKCYYELADEVVAIDGKNYLNETKMLAHAYLAVSGKPISWIPYHWPNKFSWEFIGQQFQRGYESCTGDWVIHADLDFFFHEKDFGKIRQALKDYPNAPAVSFYKWQFILPDRYNLKSRLVLAVNKKKFGDRIKFNGGGDLCQPTLDGKDIELSETPQAGVAFYNYEKLSKTKAQIIDDVERMDDAYLQHFGATLYSNDELTAYEGWLRMAHGRFNKPQEHISLSDHPKYIRDTIARLTPEQWGYSGFGELGENDYVKSRRLS